MIQTTKGSAMLNGKNIVVFDCETENEVDGKKVTWARKDLMGFSVGCLFDYRSGDYEVYLKHDIQRLAQRLNTADLIVGFNIVGFDNELIRAQGGDLKPDSELKNYDLLYHSRIAMGWSEGARYPSQMRLDDHLLSTFGEHLMKTEDGAMAPKMWREGRIGEVISYCLADVRRERMLFEHAFSEGWVKTEAHGQRTINTKPILDACGA